MSALLAQHCHRTVKDGVSLHDATIHVSGIESVALPHVPLLVRIWSCLVQRDQHLRKASSHQMFSRQR